MAADRRREGSSSKKPAGKPAGRRKDEELSAAERQALDDQRNLGNQAALAALSLLEFGLDEEEDAETESEETREPEPVQSPSLAPGEENHLAHEADHAAAQRGKGVVPSASARGAEWTEKSR